MLVFRPSSGPATYTFLHFDRFPLLSVVILPPSFFLSYFLPPSKCKVGRWVQITLRRNPSLHQHKYQGTSSLFSSFFLLLLLHTSTTTPPLHSLNLILSKMTNTTGPVNTVVPVDKIASTFKDNIGMSSSSSFAFTPPSLHSVHSLSLIHFHSFTFTHSPTHLTPLLLTLRRTCPCVNYFSIVTPCLALLHPHALIPTTNMLALSFFTSSFSISYASPFCEQ